MEKENNTRSKNKATNKSFYFTILNALNSGKSLSDIKTDLNISKQNLNYYIRKLKEKGLIKRKSYGYWESKNSTKHTIKLVPNISRGHAFIWSIKIPHKINGWNKRIEILTKNNIKFKLIGLLKTTPRIFINNKKVWLGNKNITIFETKSFYGNNAIESRKYAVISLIEVIEHLESKLGINLHPIEFKPAREHYGLIKNDLAIQCNRNKEKIHIRDDLEGEWLLIDDSLGLGELETTGKKALVRNIQVQRWWNDNKKFNFEVTPTLLVESLNKLTNLQIENQNQLLQYKEQNKQHLKLIKEYRSENKVWRKEIEKKYKDNNKSQLTLKRWKI